MKWKSLFYLILLTLLAWLIPPMHAQTFSVIQAFTAAEGATPDAGVTIRGNVLYGTLSGPGCGTVYQLTHSESNWLFSNIGFLDAGSCNPLSRVVFGQSGSLYGTTVGWQGEGAVFKVTAPIGPCRDARCSWRVNVLHQFDSGTDGRNPGYGDLIWDQQGNMYGTTSWGGDFGWGTAYELASSGNGYTERVLHSFSYYDGIDPYNGLVFDDKGNLFGTTYAGGANGSGTVFELTYVIGIGWTEQVLYDFPNASDGANPIAGLVFDSSGNLYGTTFGGGSGGGGTAFELSPAGDTWQFKLLYSFTGSDQCGPDATLTIDSAGNLYGTTYCQGIYASGNVFKLSNTPNGWVYTSLHDFTGGTDGGYPVSTVAIDTDHTLYGTTQLGGDPDCGGCGTVWMIKP